MVPKSIAVELTCTTAAAPEPNKTAPTTVWVGYTGATVAVRKPGAMRKFCRACSFLK